MGLRGSVANILFSRPAPGQAPVSVTAAVAGAGTVSVTATLAVSAGITGSGAARASASVTTPGGVTAKADSISLVFAQDGSISLAGARVVSLSSAGGGGGGALVSAGASSSSSVSDPRDGQSSVHGG